MFLLTSNPPSLISAGHIFLKTSIKDASKFSYNLYIVVSDKYETVTDKLLTVLVTGKDILPYIKMFLSSKMDKPVLNW